MSTSTFQIGDLVAHKTVANWAAPIKMTVHAFSNSNGGTVGTDASSWVFCKWYVTDGACFRKELFHVNEIQKI